MVTNNFIGKPVRSRLSVFTPKVLLALLVLLVASACSDDDVEAPKRVVLLDATAMLTRTAGELKTFVNVSGIDLDENALQYDVDIYKVRYKTTYKDEEIIASGLVVLPRTTDAVPMVSFQHGTIVTQSEAPTASPLGSTTLVLYAALSSAGFITVVPDLIGFGESGDVFHPYYVEEATASAVVDNLKAAREWAREKNVNFNSKLFLAGYSQGGYATMAAHKSLETTAVEGFDLVASFPAAGGYDVKGVQEYMFAQTTYDQPYYMAYVALSYQDYYGWPAETIGDFFQEPYATRIPGLFNGSTSAGSINSQLTDNVGDLILPDVLANIDTDPDYQYLVDAFEENSLLDWTPSTLMFMYHGSADNTVPYQNSVDTYNHFIAEGASPSVVTFTTLEGADHGSGVVPYVEDFIDKLLALK